MVRASRGDTALYLHIVVQAKESEIAKQGVRPCMPVASRYGWSSISIYYIKSEPALSDNDDSYAGSERIDLFGMRKGILTLVLHAHLPFVRHSRISGLFGFSKDFIVTASLSG